MARGIVVEMLVSRRKIVNTMMKMMGPGTWARPKRISTAGARAIQIVRVKMKTPFR